MSIIPILSAREVVRKLSKLGFVLKYQRGSHAHFVHLATGKWTTVPVHPGDLDRKIIRLIIKQSGLDLQDFLDA